MPDKIKKDMFTIDIAINKSIVAVVEMLAVDKEAAQTAAMALVKCKAKIKK